MPRELTTEEVRNQFLSHVRFMIDYWERETRATTSKQKLEGLAHSILVTLDGGSGLPAFIVAPNPHPDDQQFRIEEGEDWFPENHTLKVKADISGGLHERLFEKT